MTISVISRVEVVEFAFQVRNLGVAVKRGAAAHYSGATPGGAVEYAPGQVAEMSRYAIAIEAVDGCRGEYVTHYVGTRSALAQQWHSSRTFCVLSGPGVFV